MSKEELLKYALQMRIQGDRYRSILDFLNRNCEDEETVKEVIRTIDKLEKEKKITIQPPQKEKTRISPINLLFGGLFLTFGLILTISLWNQGFISNVPFILIAIGIMALTGSFDRFTRAR